MTFAGRARRVTVALGVTLFAAAGELGGAQASGSLFLVGDAVHLVLHTAIFGILLIPDARARTHSADRATIAILVVVLAVAIAIVLTAAQELHSGGREAPEARFILLSLCGLAANTISAWLLRDPARSIASFRPAVAHELADGMITLVALAGALAISLYHCAGSTLCSPWRSVAGSPPGRVGG